MTALCDAMGKVITRMKFQLKEIMNENEADAIVVVFTDGYENASLHYGYQEIGKLILDAQNTGKWRFIFYGADINAWQAASKMNFQQSSVFSSKSQDVKETMLNMASQLDYHIKIKNSFNKK
jgi:hypothetical protein